MLGMQKIAAAQVQSLASPVKGSQVTGNVKYLSLESCYQSEQTKLD